MVLLMVITYLKVSLKIRRNSMKMYIARDYSGELCLYTKKPKFGSDADKGFFYSDDWWEIGRNLFPEVTFENSPMEVELVIKK